MGKRSDEYIKSFLTGRTAVLIAGDIEAKVKEVGSRGTPQGSVISPLLINLMMIRVAQRFAEVEKVELTIHADDITLRVEGGSDIHVDWSCRKQ